MTPIPRRVVPLFLLAFCGTISAAPLKIIVQPAGATVTSETGQRLSAPATFELKRRDAPYVFTVEKPGYQSETVSFLVKSKLKELTVTLEPLQIDREVTITS